MRTRVIFKDQGPIFKYDLRPDLQMDLNAELFL